MEKFLDTYQSSVFVEYGLIFSQLAIVIVILSAFIGIK